jgi:hypothetical protein
LEALLSTSSAELQHHSPALSGTEVAYFSKPPEATSQLPIFLLLHQFSMKKYCLCNLKKKKKKSELTKRRHTTIFHAHTSLPLPFSIFFFGGGCTETGVELRVYTLSHYHQPVFVKSFSRLGLLNYLPGLALNYIPPPE